MSTVFYFNFGIRFQGLNIIYTGKKGVRKQLLNKIDQLETWDNRKLQPEKAVNDLSMRMNLNTVSLYFEAFGQDVNGSQLQPLCQPVVSQPIQHNSKCIISSTLLQAYAVNCCDN